MPGSGGRRQGRSRGCRLRHTTPGRRVRRGGVAPALRQRPRAIQDSSALRRSRGLPNDARSQRRKGSARQAARNGAAPSDGVRLQRARELVPLHRDSDGLSAAWLPSPAPCEFGFLLTDRFGRITRVPGSPRERPESARKPPFHCEREICFTLQRTHLSEPQKRLGDFHAQAQLRERPQGIEFRSNAPRGRASSSRPISADRERRVRTTTSEVTVRETSSFSISRAKTRFAPYLTQVGNCNKLQAIACLELPSKLGKKCPRGGMSNKALL